LAGHLAGFATGRSTAVALPFCVTCIGYEQLVAMFALSSDYLPHWWCSSWGIDIAQKPGFTLAAWIWNIRKKILRNDYFLIFGGTKRRREQNNFTSPGLGHF
jgi:hypothetical protein